MISQRYPFAWFWLADDGRVYSAAEQSIVSGDDQGFVRFKEDGFHPTRWPEGLDGNQSDAALAEVIRPYGLAISKADCLVAYANAQQWALAIGGRAITIGGVSYTFKTDPASLDLINGKAYRLSLPNAPKTVTWQIGPSQLVQIASADFIAAAIEIADWFQATFDALPEIFAGIESGSITSRLQIDEALATVG